VFLILLLVATVPTVGDAIEALTDFCDELMETLKQMAVLSAELDARDHVQVDDIRQVGDTIILRLSELPNAPDSNYRLSPSKTLKPWVTLTSDKSAP